MDFFIFHFTHVVFVKKSELDKVLSKKNVLPLLTYLLDGRKKMSELLDVISNYVTLKSYIRDLEDAGYVRTEETFEGRRVIYVELTDRGRAIAERLRGAEEIAQMDDEQLEEFKNIHLLMHFNMHEDAITLIDYSVMEGERYVYLYPRVKGKTLYLYCDLCGSTNCPHIRFALQYAPLREALERRAKDKGLEIGDEVS